MIGTETPFAWGGSLEELVGRRVIQCALSRICGGCGRPLGRPVAFLGTPIEIGRNAFACPPMHVACAEDVRALPDADPQWRITLTSGFEFVRPDRDDLDKRPKFEPNSLLE